MDNPSRLSTWMQVLKTLLGEDIRLLVRAFQVIPNGRIAALHATFHVGHGIVFSQGP
jgi:hypothetical protein